MTKVHRARIDWEDQPVMCACGAWPAPHRAEGKRRLCEACHKREKEEQ